MAKRKQMDEPAEVTDKLDLNEVKPAGAFDFKMDMPADEATNAIKTLALDLHVDQRLALFRDLLCEAITDADRPGGSILARAIAQGITRQLRERPRRDRAAIRVYNAGRLVDGFVELTRGGKGV